MKLLRKHMLSKKAGLGFSLLEVLVAVGFVSLISVGLAGIITNATKQQKGVQAKDQQREVTAGARDLLSNKTACFNSFGPANGGRDPAAGFSAPSLRDKDNVVRYDTTSTDKLGLLKFQSFDVSGWTPATGSADLRIRLSKIGDTGTVREILPDVITLKVKRDPVTLKITECFATGSIGESFWQSSPAGTPSNIFYSAGTVGIGTNDPAASLEILQATAGAEVLVAERAKGDPNKFFKVLNPRGGIVNNFSGADSVLYVGSDGGTGRSVNVSGSINAGGSDFAEWVNWPDKIKPEMGSIIFYKGVYVVVSSPHTAAFIGNDTLNKKKAILVAFSGQLPVLVYGMVNEGDLIVANGDGTGSAVSRNQVSLTRAKHAVGIAWESSRNQGLKRVNVAVGLGLGGNGSNDISKLQNENELLKQENAAIKDYLCSKDKEASICK